MTDPESTPPPLPVMLEYQPPPKPDVGESDLGPPGPIARWFLISCNLLGRFVGLFVRKT